MAPQSISSTSTTQPSPSASLSADKSTSVSPLVAAGFGIAAAVVIAILIWIAVLFHRQRQRAMRKKRTMRVRIGRPQISKSRDDTFNVPQLSTTQPAVSNSSLDLPLKDRQQADLTQEEIFEHHASNGTLPRPFAPIPGAAFNHDLPPIPPPSRPPSFLPPVRPSLSHNRSLSAASWITFPGLRSARQSTSAVSSRQGSTQSRRGSTRSSSSGAFEVHKIRQIFTPILPDELHVALGEKVAVVKHYDDGWTIVARETSDGGDTEMGAIPAWCFLKPVKGLRAERPIRSASIGVTVTFDEPRRSGRSDIISWSNF